MTNSKINVGIFCITYNHSKFIRETLNGILNQKTKYKFKIFIGDDASTDNTPDIILEYKQKFPEIFDICLNKKNIGVTANFVRTAKRIHTKYVFMCEGDDFWIDPFKIEKQVTFLELHPEFSICFHPARIHYEDGTQPDSTFPDLSNLTDKIDFSLLLKKNFIITCSVAYRWRYVFEQFDEIPEGMLPCDWYLHLAHAEIGKIGIINQVMSVYRKWNGSIWYGDCTPTWFLAHTKQHLLFYKTIERRFGAKTLKLRKKLITGYIKAWLRNFFFSS